MKQIKIEKPYTNFKIILKSDFWDQVDRTLKASEQKVDILIIWAAYTACDTAFNEVCKTKKKY